MTLRTTETVPRPHDALKLSLPQPGSINNTRYLVRPIGLRIVTNHSARLTVKSLIRGPKAHAPGGPTTNRLSGWPLPLSDTPNMRAPFTDMFAADITHRRARHLSPQRSVMASSCLSEALPRPLCSTPSLGLGSANWAPYGMVRVSVAAAVQPAIRHISPDLRTISHGGDDEALTR